MINDESQPESQPRAQNVRVSQVAPGAAAAGAPEHPRLHVAASGKKVGQALHAALRGRYHWAVIWGLILGGSFAGLGWTLAHPVFRSEGLLRRADWLPHVKEETDLSAAKPMFQTVRITQ